MRILTIFQNIKNGILQKKHQENNLLPETQRSLHTKKVTLLSDMTLEELNSVLTTPPLPSDLSPLVKEVLKRLKVKPQLLQKIMENPRSYAILKSTISFGKLFEKNQKLIFEKSYQDIPNCSQSLDTSTIYYKNGSLFITNTEGQLYYDDCPGSNPITSVKMTQNQRQGITLENIEMDYEGIEHPFKVVYDQHHLESKKIKTISCPGSPTITCIIERMPTNPFALKETQITDEKTTTSYSTIDCDLPDLLIPNFSISRKSLSLEEALYTNAEIDFDKLKQRNKVAANYFISFTKSQDTRSMA